jgi:hypothetical protein
LSKFIGVTNFIAHLDNEISLKKAALIFDHISLPGIEIARVLAGSSISKGTDNLKSDLDKIEFLIERKIIIEPPPLFGSEELAKETLENFPQLIIQATGVRFKFVKLALT